LNLTSVKLVIVDTATEVRYAGVTVGRAAHLRERDDAGAFLVFPEPLPVGTSVVLKLDGGEQAARVAGVVESADPNVAGMRLAFLTAAEAAKPSEAARPPAPASAAAPAVAAEPPTPISAAAAEPSAPISAATAEPSAPISGAAGEPASDSSPTSTAGDPHLERTTVGEAAASEGGQSSAPSAPSEGDSGSSGHGKRRRRRR
jgi:hypothetical protein